MASNVKTKLVTKASIYIQSRVDTQHDLHKKRKASTFFYKTVYISRMIFQLSVVVSQIVEDLGFVEGIREFSLDIYSSPFIQEHKRNIKKEFLKNLMVLGMNYICHRYVHAFRELFNFFLNFCKSSVLY